MQFPNLFKIIWWALLLIVTTITCIYRLLIIGNPVNFDLLLLVIWFILVALPIVDEISFLGITAKKQIRKIEDEIASIKNNNNNQMNVIFNTRDADKKDVTEKIKDEVEELFESSPSELNARKEESVLSVNTLVSEMLKKRYGTNFKAEVKLQNNTNGVTQILDGVLYHSNEVIERVFEIKYFELKKIKRMPFILESFLSKWGGMSLGIPLTLIIVSEGLSKSDAEFIQARTVSQFNKNNKNNRNKFFSFDFKFYNKTQSGLEHVY
jgi:hypothetical protein